MQDKNGVEITEYSIVRTYNGDRYVHHLIEPYYVCTEGSTKITAHRPWTVEVVGYKVRSKKSYITKQGAHG